MASARKGEIGSAGEMGSANEATPGQWRVVVAWGTPSRESAAKLHSWNEDSYYL